MYKTWQYLPVSGAMCRTSSHQSQEPGLCNTYSESRHCWNADHAIGTLFAHDTIVLALRLYHRNTKVSLVELTISDIKIMILCQLVKGKLWFPIIYIEGKAGYKCEYTHIRNVTEINSN